MTTLFSKAWDEVLKPLIKRPNKFQVAALCYRKTDGGKDVLLITSRGTGRWILPKGWPMEGKSASEAAREEAWEEAGVTARTVARKPLGRFDYIKDRDEGLPTPCDTEVYPVEVADVSDDYPEAGERERRWMPAAQAAELVEEQGLKEILRQF
ncbi:NUDIX hydrolase [Maritimibacter sp. UBA3975]|uniref:NUDIX hydrolase n=1 Tax=Maritimibacter sp. UBA3975 TaxID=1946833 RepID=UPI000C0A9F99|nr:NUDIX hydrolase [Maritimibacter sp. UBA3975]MAM62815.1 NUDIX hydrolase [Maritimibacter sp.]|tara:strand:- start:1585 stop:2043 length:459 start_codon:yes stop_codon:yes gene_type:complete